nr:hypothetical protein [Tanacetum cinerariifolium]
MKTKKQPDGDFQCAVCTRFFPDRVSLNDHLCLGDHENQLNDDLLLGITKLFYEPEEEDAYMHQLLVRIRHIQDRVREIHEQVCRAYIWFFPDRVTLNDHLCSGDHENQLNDDLLLGIAKLFYEPEKEDAYMHQLLVRIRHIQDRVREIHEQVCRAYI